MNSGIMRSQTSFSKDTRNVQVNLAANRTLALHFRSRFYGSWYGLLSLYVMAAAVAQLVHDTQN